MGKKRKMLFSSLISLCILVSFAIPAFAAASKYNCSYANVSCRGVNVTYGTAVAYSDYVYASAGQTLAVSNSSTGDFNLVTRLVDSSGNVYTPEIGFHQTVYAKVPKSGNYRVKVTCKDTSTIQQRCSGFGQVSNP
ncbi:hypothetical protein HUN92_18280 [Bacillus firmus]|uniref:hypothetical protein n=1 Tax=Cytobacillus firmus TaxID=1399 RepID=UPI001580A415|nr:hypothetical protein [Cytobacillus firmus]NUH85646.1 hypothetical protein [Cytobacillus firmus]